MSGAVAPDGSPVAVFAALPTRGVPELLHGQMLGDDSVLELGCGAGRLANALAALGHPVTGVDNSPEMLAYLHSDVEAIEADIYALDLRQRFDNVIVGSYLVNMWAPLVMAACARHVAEDGAVFVQRFAPEWARAAETDEARSGSVLIRFDPMSCVNDRLNATVTYSLDGKQWQQSLTGDVLDDNALARHATIAGLKFDAVIDDHNEWVRLVFSPTSSGGSR